jgi:hypothetical protein
MPHKPKKNGGDPMNENIIPIRKADQFFLCRGRVDETGQVIELERVGMAYLKPTSAMFRLRLWMFPKGEFFLAREDGDHFRYVALCREEYEIAGQGQKNQWHKIGVGEVLGHFVRIRFHLLSDDVYLCLFPKGSVSGEVLDAA